MQDYVGNCRRCRAKRKSGNRQKDCGAAACISINMTEAKSLFGTSDREQIIEELRSWGLELIFLRQGAKGGGYDHGG